MRDYWNNVPDPDADEVAGKIITIIEKAGRLTYYQAQELRNSAELCDRGHFKYITEAIAEQAGEKLPPELDVILEDPDFDVRVSFMKKVVDAVDPAPVPARK